MANADCLRFMGKVDKVLWTKQCNLIIRDHSEKPVDSIKACFGKFMKNGVAYIVFNGDRIITKGSYKTHVQENKDQISATIDSASPELMTRYKHTIRYDKISQQIDIKKEQALFLFPLKQQQDLTLQCE